mmetsp:Transcript_9287/g.39404  ORF Transcript_9287/g.39404 Transcript_9287/m.39404 type:complete len:290 (+) Transcript_9287:1240-2109(+)
MVFVCFAPIVSDRVATNAGLSVVTTNVVSASKGFLKLTEAPFAPTTIGPTGLGATHRPETGTTYSPPVSLVIRSTSRNCDPNDIGSNVTSRLCSEPSSFSNPEAACAWCVAAETNAPFPPPPLNRTSYAAGSSRKCANVTFLVSAEPRGTVKLTPRSGPAAVALRARRNGHAPKTSLSTTTSEKAVSAKTGRYPTRTSLVVFAGIVVVSPSTANVRGFEKRVVTSTGTESGFVTGTRPMTFCLAAARSEISPCVSGADVVTATSYVATSFVSTSANVTLARVVSPSLNP